MNKGIIIFFIFLGISFVALAVFNQDKTQKVLDELAGKSEDKNSPEDTLIKIKPNQESNEFERMDSIDEELKIGNINKAGIGTGGGSGKPGIPAGGSSEISGGESALFCNSSSYAGTCEIISISSTYASEHQVILGFGLILNKNDSGYEVLFRYSSPGNDVISSGVHSLLVNDKLYPNQAYLNKYNLFIGKDVICQAIPHDYGECSVSKFILEGVDQDDNAVYSI